MTEHASPTSAARGPSLLLRGADAILTGLDGPGARATGPDLRIVDGRIDAIGALAPRPGETVVDASGCVITPGWVNTHHHLFQSVLKGVPAAIDAPLATWLREVPYRFGPHADEDVLRVAATIGLAELALSGCTTVADHHYLFDPAAGFDPAEVLFEVAGRMGLRLVLQRGGATRGRSFDTPEIRPMPVEPIDTMIASIERTVARFHDPAPDAMRRVMVAPTTPFWSTSADELRELGRLARALGVRRHTHLSETADYVTYAREVLGTDPVPWMAEQDWLGPDVSFAHAVHLSAEEIRLLGETGTGIAHCPQSNGRLGSGVAPVAALHAAGAAVSIGVDGAGSNEAADMASELHFAWALHRAVHGASAMPVERLVHWASAGGARVLGLDAVGRLEPGAAADVAVHELSHPRAFGLHDRALAPVVGGGVPRLRRLLVGGRTVVADGAIPGLDLEALGRDAARVVARLEG